jgi:aspartate racemase
LTPSQKGNQPTFSFSLLTGSELHELFWERNRRRDLGRRAGCDMRRTFRIATVMALWILSLADVRAQQLTATQMRSVGLIGGTSWRSTIEYYRDINQGVNDVYGNNTNPPLTLYNLNQREIHDLQIKGRWDGIADILSDAAMRLHAAGAQAVIFCANTPYKVYSEVLRKTRIPILHIADAIGLAVRKARLTKVGLIGTKYTVEDGFIAEWLRKYYGIEVLIPSSAASRDELHRIIQKELGMGIFKPETKQYVLEQIEDLRRRGSQGIILGCTEFSLIIDQSAVAIPVFDSTHLHAQMVVDFILHRYEPRDPNIAGM